MPLLRPSEPLGAAKSNFTAYGHNVDSFASPGLKPRGGERPAHFGRMVDNTEVILSRKLTNLVRFGCVD